MTTEGIITAEDLKKRLDRGEVGFLFDLRNEDEFKSWRIEGRKDVETLNIPQPDFVGEEERHLSKFPKDKKIVAVCAHGDAAKYSADLLSGHGFNILSLKGGMDAWSEFYETHKVSDEPAIYQVYRMARGCIAYLIASKGTAVVIDSARHVDRMLDLAKTLQVRITQVLDTHLHADHISGGRELAEKCGAAYYLHSADAEGAMINYTPLADGNRISFGSSTIEVVHSPGHTPGSTSFLLDKRYLFTGDTIMKASLGRPDLGGKAEAWSALLYDTLFRRYAGLDDSIVVLPSHASSVREQDEQGIISTTLGQARRERDLFQIRDKNAFAAHIKKNLLENPERYQVIRNVNLGMPADEAKQKELEIGKNLCGMAKQNAAA